MAITNNVDLLTRIHKTNQNKLLNTENELESLRKRNAELEKLNQELMKETAELAAHKEKLNKAHKEMNKMLIDSQANKEEITNLYEQGEMKVEEIAKLGIEVQVVNAEKMAFKKDLNNTTLQLNKIQKDFRE